MKKSTATKIAVVSNKGGVAKTTSVVNIAGAIVKKNPKKKVLIIDLDGQGNVLSSFGKDSGSVQNTIYDVLMGAIPEGHIQSETIVKEVAEGFQIDVLPANADMNFIEYDLVEMIKNADNPQSFDTEHFYYAALTQYIDEIQTGYDYVLFDTPPEIKIATCNALSVSDYVIIPFEPEVTAIQGVSKTVEQIQLIKSKFNPHLQIAGALATKVKERTRLHSTMLNEIRKISDDLDWKVFTVEIPESVKFSETTTFHGLPLTLVDSKLKTSASYYSLIELLEKKEII